MDTDFEPVPLFFGLFMFGLGLFLLIFTLAGGYQKQLKKKLESLFGSNTDLADELLRQLLDTPVVNHTYIHDGYILVAQGCNQLLLDSDDLVWAYKQTVRQKLYGIIPLGKTYRLVLKRSDGKEHMVVMKESQVKEMLDKIVHQFPTCAIGYTDKMLELYKQDPQIMRQVAAAQRQ